MLLKQDISTRLTCIWERKKIWVRCCSFSNWLNWKHVLQDFFGQFFQLIARLLDQGVDAIGTARKSR